MSADHLIGIEKFEAHLWKMADQLRANSNLASNEYFLPIMGLIFTKARKALDEARVQAVDALREARYFVRQADWLQDHFPDAALRDVEGLVRSLDRATIATHDWSLTPGRYVGVTPEERDDDFDFEEALRAIHIDLQGLNEAAAELAARICRNFEELAA